MLGVWLLIAPFVFGFVLGGSESIQAWACGSIVIVASCLSYWRPTRHARAATALAGLWLAASSYLTGAFPAPPAIQNGLLIGLLLVMFAIIPNEASKPPETWRPFVAHPDDPARGVRS
jgi:hypothetical protein